MEKEQGRGQRGPSGILFHLVFMAIRKSISLGLQRLFRIGDDLRFGFGEVKVKV